MANLFCQLPRDVDSEIAGWLTPRECLLFYSTCKQFAQYRGLLLQKIVREIYGPHNQSWRHPHYKYCIFRVVNGDTIKVNISDFTIGDLYIDKIDHLYIIICKIPQKFRPLEEKTFEIDIEYDDNIIPDRGWIKIGKKGKYIVFGVDDPDEFSGDSYISMESGWKFWYKCNPIPDGILAILM